MYAACHMLGKSPDDELHNLALLRHFEMREPIGDLINRAAA